MKKHENCNLLVIEATDLYFDEVRSAWIPVPAFWVGDFVESHSHQIKSK